MKKVIALLVAMSTTAVLLVLIMHQNMFSVVHYRNDNASIQPSMDTNILGLDIGAWASYDTGSDSFEEVDLAIGYDVAEVSRCCYFCWIM